MERMQYNHVIASAGNNNYMAVHKKTTSGKMGGHKNDRHMPSKGRDRTRRKWSAEVMKHSNALDLEPGVFKGNPRRIAASLKRSAMRSQRRKGTPYQSAMSMLNFHINRGGKNFSVAQRRRLEQAKSELRRMFGKA
ncbi:MAG: hypothetical protein Nkreftii_002341 [Candidatus Nitrospira kreftii]|uniref:DUF3175 domain-containing protein n=1 Tax=Candidatus Nitrospira kreftii TaxID=2652173 RepID=A0A7S8FEY8_9BACT|nr:MAG: hypothetical protein Nkreftii_002341 [Candidatus Nitrospira kreftii]